MCIYHQRIQIISRGQGKSGVAALAYRSGTKLFDHRTGMTFDYTNKSVERVEFILPDNVPEKFREWARDVSSDKERVLQEFSDLVEFHEKRSDSQIYREFEFALQRELTDEQNYEIAREHIKRSCAAHGMVSQLSFHKELDKETGKENFHCHTLILTRSIDEEGLDLKNREWNSKEFHQMYRENLAIVTNEKFAELGINKRIDHRSLEEQGIDLKPIPKLGRSAIELASKGIESLRYKIFQDNKRHNLFLIQQRPDHALEVISNNQSTFTELDVKQLIGRYADTQDVFSNLYARIMSSSELVQLENSSLDPSEKKGVFTTRSQLKSELIIAKKSEALANRTSHKVDKSFVDSALAHLNHKLKDRGGLSQDQVNAIRHITGPEQLAVLVGYAGAGKSTALNAAKMAWEMQGYKVLGLAPTGTASDNLRKEGFEACTLASFFWQYDHGRMQLKKETIIVLDEGGMVDSRNFRKLIDAVDKLGVKLAKVGDRAQNFPVQAGPSMRLVEEASKVAKIESIVRQEEPWQKEATGLFGRENTKEALELYQKHGCIQLVKQGLPTFSMNMDKNLLVELGSTAKQMAGMLWYNMEYELQLEGIKKEDAYKQASGHPEYNVYKKWKRTRDLCLSELKKRGLSIDKSFVDLRKNAKMEMVRDWLKDRELYPNESSIMLANSRKEVDSINSIAREILKDRGLISKKEYFLEVEFKKDKGLNRKSSLIEKRGFSIGDQIIFRANDNGLKVSNGNIGIIQDIQKDKVTVKLNEPEARIVSFSNRLYKNIEHGWATTILSSQGNTYHRVKCLASFEMFRNLIYVAATRHKIDFKLYGSEIEFHNILNIILRLSRANEKLLTNDYISPEVSEKATGRSLTLEQAEKLADRDKNILEKAENALIRVKDYSHAVSHFVKGIFKKTTDEISPDVYGNRSEADRAIDILGLSSKERGEVHGLNKTSNIKIDHVLDVQQKTRDGLKTVGDGPISDYQLSLRKKPESVAHLSSEYDPAPKSSRETHLFDMDKLSSVLEKDGERLVTHLLGQEPNPSLSTNKQKRYGTKGSFSYNCHGPKAGKWHDFEAGQGGDIFKLVARELGISQFKEQLNYVAGFYSLSPEKVGVLSKTPNPIKMQKNVDDKENKLSQINKAYELSKPIEGTLAEKYLRDHRHIEGKLPVSLRFLSSYGKEKMPAMVSFATDEKGVRTGMQVTYLDPHSAKKADIAVNKRSHGIIKGSSVVLREGRGQVYVAEGVETALSLAASVPRDSTILATLGKSNFYNLKATNEQNIIICADNDENKKNNINTLEKAILNLESQGAKVIVITPEKEGQDFNDVLKDEGVRGVSKYIEKVEAQFEAHSEKKLTKLKASLLEDLKSIYKTQFRKDMPNGILNSKTEPINIASEYLFRSGSDVLSENSIKQREAALKRAEHELKASPERAQDYYRRLKDERKGTQEGIYLAVQYGERLAIIEGRLIEQDVLKGGSGQRRWEISNPARIELEENDKKLEMITSGYRVSGMYKEKARIMASLHIRYKEMFGREPIQGEIEQLKAISEFVARRNQHQQIHREKNENILQTLPREETILLRNVGIRDLSQREYSDVQGLAEKSISNEKKYSNLENSKMKDLER